MTPVRPDDRGSPLGTPRSRLSRRGFVAGAAAVGAGLGGGVWTTRSPVNGDDGTGTKTLQVLCWQGYDDPVVLDDFRRQHGVPVAATYLGANDEVFTFLRANGLGKFDVVTPSNGVVKALVADDLLQPLDRSRLPSAADYLPPFQQPEWAVVDGNVYAAPFLWGTAPMVYAAKHLAKPPSAWVEVQEPLYRGKVVMVDDLVGHYLIWNRVMGAPDPARVTQQQLSATTDLLVTIKREQTIAMTNMADLAGRLARGEGWVSTIGWESVPLFPVAQGADLRTVDPSPGDYSFCDSLCIPQDAPHLDAAYAFIDYMLSPRAQATVIGHLARGTVNATAVALLDPTVRALHPYDNLDQAFVLSPLRDFPPFEDADDGIATYIDWINHWDRVRLTPMKSAAKK